MGKELEGSVAQEAGEPRKVCGGKPTLAVGTSLQLWI